MRLALSFAALALLFLTIPDASAAPGVQPWNRACIKFYSEWQKKPKHKAFAVATSDYHQSCGGSWAAGSVKAAEEAARKWCKRSSERGASCRITKSE